MRARAAAAIVALGTFVAATPARADEARAGETFVYLFFGTLVAIGGVGFTTYYTASHAGPDDPPPNGTVMGVQLAFDGGLSGLFDVTLWSTKPAGNALFLGLSGWTSSLAGFAAGALASDRPEMRGFGATVGLETAALNHGIYALGRERTSAFAGGMQAAFGAIGVLDGIYLARPDAHPSAPAGYYAFAAASGVIALDGLWIAFTSGERRRAPPPPPEEPTSLPRAARIFPGLATDRGYVPGVSIGGLF